MSAPAPAGRRYARRLALVAVAGAGAATLAACQKPLPQVTFQSGSRSVLVSPVAYCYDDQNPTDGSCPARKASVVTLRTSPGDDIGISVPRSVAVQAWIASAYTLTADGKSEPVDGGTGVIQDNHYARVPVPNASGVYLLSVTQLRGQEQIGTWTVQVEIEN